MTVVIERIDGIYYINGKRLGHEPLSEAETNFLNDFIREQKQQYQV